MCPIAGDLDQTEFANVAADCGLRCPKTTLPERRGKVLLCPNWAPIDEIPDSPLTELLDDLHRIPGLPIPEAQPGHDHDAGQDQAVHDEDHGGVGTQEPKHHRDPDQPGDERRGHASDE